MNLLSLIPGSGPIKAVELIAGVLTRRAGANENTAAANAILAEHAAAIEAELQKAYLATGKVWVYAPHIVLQYLLDLALAFVVVFWMVECLRSGELVALPDNLFGLAASSGGFRAIFSLFR